MARATRTGSKAARTKASAGRSKAARRRAPARRSKAAKPEATARKAAGRASTSPARRAASATAPPLPMPAVLVVATEEPDVVEVPARTVVAIDGAGPPDGEAFGRSLGALYGAAYGLKFSRKGRGATFKVGPLEGRWWAEGAAEGPRAPRETWRWRLRMAVPDDVSEAELDGVIGAAISRKGGKLEGSEAARRVFVERVPRATLGRILHVGPYADEPRSFARVDAALAAAGRRPSLTHLEVYLSDPRRTAPARLRTVLLREIVP